MIVVDPNQFKTEAMAWIEVVSVVGVAGIGVIGNLWGKVQMLREGHAQNHAAFLQVNELAHKNALAIQNTPVAVVVPATTPNTGTNAAATSDASTTPPTTTP